MEEQIKKTDKGFNAITAVELMAMDFSNGPKEKVKIREVLFDYEQDNANFSYQGIIYSNGQIISEIYAIKQEDNLWTLKDLWVEEDYRNKGIGGFLIKQLLAKVFVNIDLAVGSFRTGFDFSKAVNFYKKYGFEFYEDADDEMILRIIS